MPINPLDLRPYTPPDTAPPDEIAPDVDHIATASAPNEDTVRLLHLGAGEETACGKPRGGLDVTDSDAIFAMARAHKLASQPRVCPGCDAVRPGSGYRG